MKTLIVGVGALGGMIAARMSAADCAVWLATRNADAAAWLKQSGLRLTGVGGEISAALANVAPLCNCTSTEKFDLIVLATKALDAIETAPRLTQLLGPNGVLLPIQNGGVAEVVARRLGADLVLGGLSNFGATMTAPGVYEMRNAGHLLIGELAGGPSERAERVRHWLGRAVETRVTENYRGAVWSKLLLNCSVTTIGALAGRTMRQYIALPEGRELFDRAYAEALAVASASGIRLERMMVDPLPPGWRERNCKSLGYETWIDGVVEAYGDLTPSMLQDFDRGRRTEIDFINGHVVSVGRQFGVATPMNAAIVETVRAIEERRLTPSPSLLRLIV